MTRLATTEIVRDSFEKDFLASPLEDQVALCDGNPLAGVFRENLGDHQPILEAGCGSGRWVAWFARQGWSAAGLDWSEALCRRAASEIPQAWFVAGDMRAMPFGSGEFGSIVALGSVEHTVEGPHVSLREFVRVLRPGGIAIITVPYAGGLRRFCRVLQWPLRRLRESSWIRRATGRPAPDSASLAAARRQARPGWMADFAHDGKTWSFYQYSFSRPQMRSFLRECGFVLRREFTIAPEEGLFHTFGRAAGTWNAKAGRVELTIIGRLLRAVLPSQAAGHMLCGIVEKPAVGGGVSPE